MDAALQAGHTEYVDADLSRYFDTIPHRELMRSVERRVADPKVLWLIRHWLKAPVHETNAAGRVVISGGRKTKQGTPQGGVISPLLANIYFRRLLVAWQRYGLERKLAARIVNYADDFVILTRGQAQRARAATRRLVRGLGLTLNEEKTRTGQVWKEAFNFLGYTFGKLYTQRQGVYLGFRPSAKSVARYRERVRQLTAMDQTCKDVESVAAALNRLTRGYWNYYNVGTTSDLRCRLDRYLFERTVRWIKNKFSRASGQRRYTAIRQAWRLLVQGRTLPRHASVSRGTGNARGAWAAESLVAVRP